MAEDNNIFREKSLSKFSSPEGLDQYIKTTTPSLWIMLAAIIVFLAGVLFWAVTGRIDSSTNLGFEVKDNVAVTYLSEDYIDKVKEDTAIEINGERYTIGKISGPVSQSDESSKFLLHAIDLDVNEDVWYYEITCDTNCEDGEYLGKIVFESISPIGLIIN